jgi:hypothetical protein
MTTKDTRRQRAARNDRVDRRELRDRGAADPARCASGSNHDSAHPVPTVRNLAAV